MKKAREITIGIALGFLLGFFGRGWFPRALPAHYTLGKVGYSVVRMNDRTGEAYILSSGEWRPVREPIPGL